MNRIVQGLNLAMVALLVAFLASGCIARPSSSSKVVWQTPKDPPPIPKAKPTPPQSFAAQTAQQKPASRARQSALLQPVNATVSDVGVGRIPAIDTPAPPTSAKMTGPGVYHVRAGDTLYGLSRRFGVSMRDVIAANSLKAPYLLHVGQAMTIPQPNVYKVRKGDTLYGISRAHGVELRELVSLNRIAPPYSLKIGQAIKVPQRSAIGKTRIAGSTQDARKTASAETLAAAKTPPPSPEPAPSAQPVNIPDPAPRQSSRFLWPVDGQIISNYGPRAGGLHNDGINILAPRGTPILAAENGVVVYAGTELSGFGKLILIKHADGWVTAYAHNDNLMVRRGQRVRRGETIGRIGTTGSVDRPQLHFEIRKGIRAVDPIKMLAPRTTAALD